MVTPFIVMIPARYGSTRLPGKPLVDLCGKPMIAHVVARALRSGAQQVIVVTDHHGVASAARAAGAAALTFTGEYESGTDRLAAASVMLDLPDDAVIVNLQGDEPLMPSGVLASLAAHFVASGEEMATVAELVPPAELHTLSDPNIVKVVTDENDRALYFSRSVIPFDREQATAREPTLMEQYLRHAGLYAYRARFLREFVAWGSSPLERMEKLEQLRMLSKGRSVAVLTTSPMGAVSVDTAADAARVRAIMEGWT